MDAARSGSPSRDAGNELLVSLAVLGALLLFGAIVLAYEHDWREIVRAALAFLAYASLLLRSEYNGVRTPASFTRMLLAGAAAGLINGTVRPHATVALAAASTVLIGALLSAVHWLVLRGARRLLDDFGRT